MPLRNYLVEIDARAWPRFARMAQTGVNGWWANGERVAFDPAHQYRVRLRARRIGGTDGTIYGGVALFNATGANITGDGAQWFYAASGVAPGSTWTDYSGLFGAGTGRPFPGAAARMAPLFILNYGSTGGIADLQYLYIEDVTAGNVVVSVDPWLFDPAAWKLLLGARGEWRVEVGSSELRSRTLRYSTAGFMTSPTDTPANAHYPARVQSPGVLRQELPQGFFGVASVSYGEIVLDNSDGALSELVSYGLDAAEVRVKVVTDQAPGYGTAVTLLTAAADRAMADDRLIRIRLRSPDAALDKPYCGRYAGTGGAEGDGSMAGVRKPAHWGGALTQVEPVAVVPANNVYQLSAQPQTVAPSVLSVSIAGVAVTRQTPDYASLADLLATAPTAGQARWYAGSSGVWVRINATVNGVVTCDYTGPAWEDTRPWDMVRAVALAAGLTSGQMAQAAGWDLPTPDNWPGTLFWPSFSPRPSLWIADDTSARDVVDRICAQAGAWAGFVGWSGVFSAPQWGMATLPSRAGLTEQDKVDRGFTAAQILRVRPISPPAWDRVLQRFTLRTRRNWRPLLPAEVPTGYAPAMSREWRLSYSASDAATLAKHPTAGEAVREWTEASTTTADAEVARRLALFKFARQWFEVDLPLDAVDDPYRTFRPTLGGLVYLTWPTLQVVEADGTIDDGGWFMVCAGEVDLAVSRVRLTVREAHLVTVT